MIYQDVLNVKSHVKPCIKKGELGSCSVRAVCMGNVSLCMCLCMCFVYVYVYMYICIYVCVSMYTIIDINIEFEVCHSQISHIILQEGTLPIMLRIC